MLVKGASDECVLSVTELVLLLGVCNRLLNMQRTLELPDRTHY